MRFLIPASILALFMFVVGCEKNPGPGPKSALRVASVRTFSSFDPPSPGEKVTPVHGVKFEQADLARVLDFYAEISGRSVIRSGNLPDVKITFSNQTPLTTVELLQALDTVLAVQNIVTVPLGTQYVKVIPARDAPSESGPIVELEPSQLPDSSSFLIYIVKLKNIMPDQTVSALQPFAKLPNSIISIRSPNRNPAPSKANLPPPLEKVLHGKDPNILILRDYSSNVRQMLQVLEKLDQP